MEKAKFNYSFNMQQPTPVRSVEQLLDAAVNQHQRGQFQQAEQLYSQVLKQQPKHAYTLNLLGVLLSQAKGQHEEAEKLISRAIKIESNVADYHNNLGLCLQQQAKFEKAAKAFARATRLNPGLVNAWFGLGNVNINLKKPEVVITSLQKVIELDPGFLPAYNNLGNVYRELNRFDEALDMFNKVLELKPDFAEGWYNIGVVYKSKSDGEQAIQAFTKAIELKPDYVKAYNKMGMCRGQLLDDMEGALQEFNKALEIDPQCVPSYLQMAVILREFGKFDEAEDALRKALEIDETSVDAFIGLARGKAHNEKDLAKLQEALDTSDLDTKHIIPLHFSLGKIFDERSEYEKAFRHFQKGNELHRKSYEYDVTEFEHLVSRLIDTFSEDNLGNIAISGETDSELPVFIVGMPRSGTTLTEQIIASHQDVYGAGELEDISRISHEWAKKYKNNCDYLDFILHAQATETEQLASDYLEHIRALAGDVRRVTDKMPHNFLHLGLISILFPKARIIHCTRDPMDTCLSIYTQKFTSVHPYAFDLTELGQYYRQYLRLMTHWERVLAGRIFMVQYEELIEEPEAMSRKLIGHINLPWDDRCLDFHETERSVKTASQWQVRQPVYKKSVNRWKNYETHLAPLKKALGYSSGP